MPAQTPPAGRAGRLEGDPDRVGRPGRQAALKDGGVPADQAAAIADDYGKAQLHGLKRAIGAVAIFALLSLWFTRGLPARRLT